MSPFAESSKGVSIDLHGGPTIDCATPNDRKKPEELAAARQQLQRGFVSLGVDTCAWQNTIEKETDGVLLYRNGADVACRFEAEAVTGVMDPGAGAFYRFMASKPVTEVTQVASTPVTINGETWRKEIVRLRLPAKPPAMTGVLYRYTNWAWFGTRGTAAVTCWGADTAMQADAAEEDALVSALKIDSSRAGKP